MAMMAVTSCTDSDYTIKYSNPAQTAVVSCDKVMNAVFVKGKQYSMGTYYRLFTFETQFTGLFAQCTGFSNGKDVYSGMGVSYLNARWTNFYDMLAQLNLLKATYEGLSDENKAVNKIYLDCATIYVYDQLQQMVDLWGDVPFSKASTLPVSNDLASSYASYDSATDLYTMMLADLKTIATELGSMNITSVMQAGMKAADWVNKGDVSLWVKYANGLRMRIAMRCATQGDLAAQGKAALKEIFEGGATMVADNSDEVLIDVASYGGDFEMLDKVGIQQGWESWAGKCNRASKVMLDIMNYGTDNVDPRLPVMLDPCPYDNTYRGMSPEESAQQQSDWFGDDKGNHYAAVDSATFSRNTGYINPVISAAEVSLTKAEAIARGYITGSTADAKTAFVKGVIESVNFYYKENKASSYRTAVTKPSDDVIKAYAESQWDDANPIKCICEQEWLNYSFPQMTQAYFNVRRTGYPELKFVTYKSSAGIEFYLPVDRLQYPSDEINYNATNLKAELDANFGGTDTWYKKVFWAKESGTWFTPIDAVK